MTEFTGMNLDDAVALRHRRRQERSKPIAQEIGRIAAEVRALSDSPIARAVKYLENQWAGLIRFLDDPRIPITSNAAEAALRCLVLGRNNHFGSKSKRGTEVAAMFYSLMYPLREGRLAPDVTSGTLARQWRGSGSASPRSVGLFGSGTEAA